MNKIFKLASRPQGLPKRSDFSYEEAPIPTAGDGELVVKIHFISLDPAMRGWMNDSRSYIRPVEIGEVMRASTVGEVIESKNPQFKVGDHVVGMQGVQSYGLSNGKGLSKVSTKLAPLQTYLGALGGPGLTAYFGLLDVGQPKAGETVLVSAASGAVGSVVGQIAKIKGCRVVGIAGGAEKCRYLTEELGFDAAIDYKNEDVRKAIRKACPDRVDVYFDNVGGEILDHALANLNLRARVVICGAISQYNESSIQGPKNYLSLLVSRARMEGLVIFDYKDRFMEAYADLGKWLATGQLKTKEQVEEGIENFPETLLRLFSGEKMGKLVLKV